MFLRQFASAIRPSAFPLRRAAYTAAKRPFSSDPASDDDEPVASDKGKLRRVEVSGMAEGFFSEMFIRSHTLRFDERRGGGADKAPTAVESTLGALAAGHSSTASYVAKTMKPEIDLGRVRLHVSAVRRRRRLCVSLVSSSAVCVVRWCVFCAVNLSGGLWYLSHKRARILSLLVGIGCLVTVVIAIVSAALFIGVSNVFFFSYFLLWLQPRIPFHPITTSQSNCAVMHFRWRPSWTWKATSILKAKKFLTSHPSTSRSSSPQWTLKTESTNSPSWSRSEILC